MLCEKMDKSYREVIATSAGGIRVVTGTDYFACGHCGGSESDVFLLDIRCTDVIIKNGLLGEIFDEEVEFLFIVDSTNGKLEWYRGYSRGVLQVAVILPLFGLWEFD